MNKKKVLDYDPKTGFGKFAEIMNANNAIDMAQNKVNTGMAPVTAPVANPAAPVKGVPGLNGGSTVDLGGDETADHGIEGGAAVGEQIPTVSEQIPTVSGGETESGAVSGGATDTGNSTGIGTNVGSGVGTGTSVSAATGVTANPITTIPSYKGDFGSYENWMTQNGYDPDTDYNNAKAALEYDYETSMATYGRRAEELYQMGLSNSGVSDIYQLGAFNAYLAAQNDLAYQNIEAKKKYRQEYNTLYDANQKAMQADTANAYNFALEQFDYEMDSDGNFTTNNAENIRAQLLSQGYDKTVVDNVINMLNALDPATLPTEKAQAEERKKAQEEANAKAELMTTAKRLAFNAYNNENIGEVETLLLNTPGVDSQMAQEILDELKKLTPEQLADSTAYKKKLEADVNEVNKLVVELGDTYDSSKEAAIRNLYSDWDKTKLDLLIEKLEGYNTVAKPSEEEMAVAGMNAVKQIMGEGWSYDGGDIAKEEIRRAVAGTEYSEYAEQIIAQFDKDRQSMASAAVTQAVNKNVGEATIDELESAWSNAKDVYADDANSLNKIKGDMQGKVDAEIDNVLNSDTELRDLYNFVGYDQAAWDELSAEEQSDKIVEAIMKYRELGLVSDDKFKNYYEKTIADSFKEFRASNKANTTDKDNRYSLGFIKDVANSAQMYVDLWKQGKISNEDYYAIMDQMYKNLDVDEQKGLFRNMFVDTDNDENWWGQAIQDYTTGAVDVMANIGTATAIVTGGKKPLSAIPQLVRSGVGHVLGEVSEDSFGDQIGGLEDNQRTALAEMYYAAYRDARSHDKENKDGEAYLQQGTRRVENLFGWKNNAVTNLMEERYKKENPEKQDEK